MKPTSLIEQKIEDFDNTILPILVISAKSEEHAQHVVKIVADFLRTALTQVQRETIDKAILIAEEQRSASKDGNYVIASIQARLSSLKDNNQKK